MLIKLIAIRLLLPFLLFALTQLNAHAAEVIAVDPIEDCFLCSSKPSMTMYWQSPNAKVVLLVIPGGSGLVGLTAEKKDLKQPFFDNLKRLTNKNLTKGQVDLVVIDSPGVLTYDAANLSGRDTKEHMIRIESILRYYKNKTGLPVWILGQSNGGASLANFTRYIHDQNRTELIAGAIASTPRPESNFSSSLNFPLIFINHRWDGCRNLDQIHAMYERVKNSNTAKTEWVMIEGGEAEVGKDPCRSGFHMFYQAGDEYAKAIEDFLVLFN